jgi:hypothetical protein
MINEDKLFVMSVRTPVRASAEEHEYALQALRRRAGMQLYDIVYANRLPAVVDITEILVEQPKDPYQYLEPMDEVRIEISVIPVTWKHVTMAAQENHSIGRFEPQKKTALSRFWSKITKDWGIE